MNRKQFLLALVFVAVFSFIGGIVGGTISGGGIIMAAKDLLDDSTLFNPKQINYLQSKFINSARIRAEKLITTEILLVNGSNKVVGRFSVTPSDDPIFALYSKERPLMVGENWKDAFSIQVSNSEPIIMFRDKDLDARIFIGVTKLEPSIDFLYKGKNRLTLGTNVTVSKNTGNVTKYKGSICTFDNKGNLTSQMP